MAIRRTDTSSTRRLRRLAAARPWLVDALWAAVLALLGGLLTANAYAVPANEPFADQYASAGQAVVAAALTYVPLVARRRWPIAVLAVVSVAHLLHLVWVVPEGIVVSVAYLLAMYTVGDQAPDPWRLRARIGSVGVVGAAYVWVFFAGVLSPASGFELGTLSWVSSVVMVAVFLAAAWLLGDAAHQRRVRESLLRQRAAELEVEREENARRAVFAERVRIARELHDLVAHTVSVMGIQAGAARRVFDTDADAAAQELASIETTSRTAVAELQQMLELLRDPDAAEGGPGSEEAAPPPRLQRIEELVRGSTAAGVHTDLTVVGEPDGLPEAVSVSAYRIVQEALTNVRRHSGAARAEVAITYGAAHVEVEILDDGRGPRRSTDAVPGYGLVGMRERVALHDGALEWGARQGGGFRVWARLPYEAVTTGEGSGKRSAVDDEARA